MVWARQDTQIDSAARLMKICSRRCREVGSAVQRCVIVLGECNAPPPLPRSSPSLSRSIIPRRLRLSSCSSELFRHSHLPLHSLLSQRLTLPECSSSKMLPRPVVDRLIGSPINRVDFRHLNVIFDIITSPTCPKCANLFKKAINPAAK